MRKFKIKNRQKRKYTRHNVPQSSYQFSPLLAGFLPALILAIALAATILMNMNLREQAVITQPQFQLSLPKLSFAELLKPIQSLPNLFIQPVAFLAGLGTLLIDGFGTIVLGLSNGFVWFGTLLDPRPGLAALGQGTQSFLIGVGYTGMLLMDGFARVGELFVQSTASVGMHIATGSHTIWTTTVAYALFVAEMLTVVFWVLLNSFVQLVVFLFNGVVSIVTFIADAVMSFINAVVRIILTPFQILGVFWMQVKPYVDLLLHYCGLALEDTGKGFNNLAKIGSIFSK